MKYIEKKYQQLIEDMDRAYTDVHDTLKYHINELKKMLAEKDEEIEKLKGGNRLQAEIDEYNRLEAQNNMNLEDEIARLKAENSRIKKAKVQVKPPRKFSTKIVKCVDCGAEFHAKTNKKKRCSKCELTHKRNYQRVWVRKKNANASK